LGATPLEFQSLQNSSCPSKGKFPKDGTLVLIASRRWSCLALLSAFFSFLDRPGAQLLSKSLRLSPNAVLPLNVGVLLGIAPLVLKRPGTFFLLV